MKPARLLPLAVSAVITLGLVAGCGSSSSKTASSTQPSAGASQAGAAGGGTFAQIPSIVKDAEPSVVTITTPIGLGSGVVYSADGVIVTDAHVVSSKSHQTFPKVTVHFADGRTTTGQVAAADQVDDVAVVRVGRHNLPPLEFANNLPQPGDMAIAIGSPLGLTNTVTAGIVSALHRDLPPTSETPLGLFDLVQTDAAISPGNSGGAVVGADGRALGLAEAYVSPKTGAVSIGFFTPASTVVSDVKQLLAHGKVAHAFLGVLPHRLTPQLASKLGLPGTSGVLVLRVSPSSPASRAGIQPGDVITRLGNTDVTNELTFLEALRHAHPGQRVDVTLRRDGKTIRTTARLVQRPKA